MSLTTDTPKSSAVRATTAFVVSTETGTETFLHTASTTGARRRISSARSSLSSSPSYRPSRMSINPSSNSVDAYSGESSRPSASQSRSAVTRWSVARSVDPIAAYTAPTRCSSGARTALR